MQEIPRHQCLIYEASPARYLPALVSLIRHNLKENNRCLYLNSPPMVAGLRSYLFAGGVDVHQEVMKGSLVLSSDKGHLQKGSFDIDRMLAMLTDAVNQALNEGYQRLWVTGDMSWEFGPEKDFSRLLEYEWRLEELFRKHPTLSGICQYHMDTLPREVVRRGLLTHQAIFINDTLSRLNPQYIERECFNAHPKDNADIDNMINRLCKSLDQN
ncbi:MEDS domain-containing protein [Nitrospira sp. Nam74]